jgi:hypothetical protein
MQASALLLTQNVQVQSVISTILAELSIETRLFTDVSSAQVALSGARFVAVVVDCDLAGADSLLNREGSPSNRESWSFDLAPKPLSRGVPRAELCFEGKNPAVQVRFENCDLSFTLDTGASTTDLYPPFAAAFPELIRTSGKKETHQMTGVGSAENLNATVLPQVDFKVGGHPVALHPATVLLEPNGESSKFYYGNLGIDLLKQARRVTLDFKRMSLTLQ